MKLYCGLALFVFVWLLHGSMARCATCESFQDCGQSASGNYGCSLAAPREVDARSNGGWTGSGCGYYQCVEYVKRYYSNSGAMHYTTTGWSGNGNDYFASAETKGLRSFAQGSLTRPKENDILCFEGGPGGYGHVAIITSVANENTSVTIVDQNRSSSQGSISLGMTVSNGSYSIDPLGSLTVQGWLRGYTCVWDHQDPSGTINLSAGQSYEFKVWFENTSRPNSPDWTNDGGDLSIELRSCDVQGTEASCWLLPVSGKPSWLDTTNRRRIVRSSNNGVGTNELALFDFWGKVPDDAAPGLRSVHFRPYHNSGQWIQDWGGLSFNVNVVAPIPEASYTALVGNFNGDALTDIGLYESTSGRWFVAGDQTDEFNQINGPDTYNSWLNDWGTGSGYTPLVGDFNEDGKADVCVYRSQYGRWYVALNNYGTANSFTQANGPYDESSWITDWGTGSGFTPLVGDFNGDGKTDICVYRPQYGRWYVALNNYGTQNSFTQSDGLYSESSWLTDWGTGSGYTPLVGDFNGDGKSDIALYQAQYGRWFVAFNNYGTQNSFTQANGTYTVQSWYTDWGTGSGNVPLIGDFNNDGKSDIAYYQSQYGRWYVAYNDYSTYNRFDVASGTATNGSWLTDWGTGSGMTPLLGNFSTGPHDIGLFDPSLGRWFVAFNDYGTAQRFTQADGPYAAFSWYDDWGKESGSQKIVAAGGVGSIPLNFTLSQNYPNPFNPATVISYTVPEASHVSLKVYNILGQEVATLVDSYQPTGSYTVPFDASSLPSGVYLYRLHTDQATETRKMVILK